MTPRGERGAALLMAVLIVALVSGLGGALLLVTAIETRVEGHHAQAHAVQQAAESGLACGLSALRAAPQWTAVLDGTWTPFAPCLPPGALPPAWPGGAAIEPVTLTGALQAATQSRYGSLADLPRWRLLAAGAAPGAHPEAGPVVLVWVTDDVDDGDGDPSREANAIVWVRAEAYGRGAARAVVEAVVVRGSDGIPPAAVVNWRAGR